MLGRFEVVQDAVALGQALPDQRVREEPATLSVAGERDGLPRRLERLSSMTAGVGPVADVLLEFRVLEHALQKPRSRHDDVVGFQFGDLKGRNRLVARPVELAVVEVQVPQIEMYVPGAVYSGYSV